MKKYIVLILLVLIMSGCTSEDRDSINVLNWSSYIPMSVINDFTKETGIKVNYSTYSSNEELLAKVSSVKSGTYDLVFPSDYMVSIMKDKGLLSEIDSRELVNYYNINSSFLGLEYDDSNKYSIPFLAASLVISVNRDNISDDITSYNDLLNNKFKNNIVLVDDSRIIIGVALLANGFDMNSTNKNELNIAYKWLMKLKDNIKAYDSDSPKNFLISKEADIGLMWNAEASIASRMNKNIENIFPIEGTPISIDNFCVLKGAKNTDKVYKFIDYILRGDVMKKIIDSYPYKNVNKNSEFYLDEDYLNNKTSNFSDDVILNGKFVKNIGDKISLFDKIWAKIK